MKLLCVTSCFPSKEKPFYCIFIYQQLKELMKLGVDVDVLVPDTTIIDSKVVEKFKELNVFRFKYTETKWYENPLRKNKLFFENIKELLSLKKYNILQFDIIPYSILNIFNKLKTDSTIFSVHVHGLNIWGDFYASHISNLIHSLLKLKAFKKVDCFVGVSHLTSKIILKRIKNSRVYTVYNGVDPSIFYPINRQRKSIFTIGIVANLIKIKGHIYLLKALKMYIEKSNNDNIVLKIIGSGPEKNNIISLINELGIQKNITLIDCLNYEDVARFLREECDMFIMPSFFESLGCVYLEAMASRVLTVGVKGCGIDEIIVNKTNGFLIRKQNVNDIYTAIDYAIKNEEICKKIANNGYETVTKKYTWNESALNLFKIYQSELEKRNGKI